MNNATEQKPTESTPSITLHALQVQLRKLGRKKSLVEVHYKDDTMAVDREIEEVQLAIAAHEREAKVIRDRIGELPLL